MSATQTKEDFMGLEEMSETEILQMLHRKKMSLIEERFQQRGRGLAIDQFLLVMLQHLDYDKSNQRLRMQITLALIDFFKEVDVNGDETMEWEQFSNHIIELGLVRNDRSFKNVIKSYFPSDKVVDREKHETGIENIYYFQKLKNLFMIEKESSRFKVYNVNNAALLYEVNAQKGNILDLEFLEQQNLIATSSNDLTINFWDASSFTLKQIVSVPEIQLRIRYADWKQAQKQLLYTGGSDAIIHIYDAATLKERGTISGWNPFYKSDQQQEGHSSPIGDILPIDSQQTLVTACLGGNICLWDSNSHQLKKELRGHDKGVYSLDWCDWSQMNHCLLSAGLDHEAFVWNTYVKDKIFLLRGHNHPLVSVKCLPETPQIVTADIAGMVKVWDVRNFLCIQTFNAPVDELSSFCLTYSKAPNLNVKKRIICSDKKLHYFEYDEPKDQLLTDEKPCFKVIFNLTLLCFITMHADCLKIWDARTGKLMSVYRELCNPTAQLTAMALDNRERKLFVGDSQGCIFTVNIKNGAKMKEFQKHEQAVSGICFWANDASKTSDERYADLRRIISISMGTEVNIHDEDAPQDAKSSCRYVMKQHKKGVNTVGVRAGTETLVTGSDDGNTILTNLISYRHQILPRHSETQIRHVLFLDPYECLISVDLNGKIVFYGVGENKFKNKILFAKQYVTESMTKTLEAFPVTCLKFYMESQYLLIGDEFGNVQIWSLGQVIETLMIHKLEKSVFSRRREKKNIQESLLLTEIKRPNQDIFCEQMVYTHLKLKGIHLDGVTSIELIKENQAFITASFDCCCYIWRLADGVKIGSLLLGGDPNWKLLFDMEFRKRNAITQARALLERIGKKKHFFYSDSSMGDEQATRQYEAVKANVLRGARELIESQKKAQTKNENLLDILGDTSKLEKDFFNEEEQNSFDLMSQFVNFKSTTLSTKKKR